MAEVHLSTPISEEEIRKLKLGDALYISGTMFMARDEAHERALEMAEKGEELPLDFEGLVVFHCGPIVRKLDDDRWKIVAAGPTTSTRMDLFEAEFLEEFNVRVVVGKGGMGSRTAEAMKKVGSVYVAATGGAAVLAANAMEVTAVHWLDLGTPEALWVIKATDFGPLTVAIDSHGGSLYENVKQEVQKNKAKAMARIGIT